MIRRLNYRLYPNAQQAAYFQQIFGSCRWVYNWALDLKTKSYEESKARGDEKPKGLSLYDISKMLTQKKKEPEFSWLNETPSVCHNWALQHLDTAFKNFFKGHSKYPQFKTKHKSSKTFSYHQGYKIIGNKISVPKTTGLIPFIKHRAIAGQTKTVTIKQEPSGKYYASIVVDDGLIAAKPFEYDPERMVGLDVGVVKTITLSDGFKIILNTDYEKENYRQLKSQRELSRKEVGSRNFQKAKIINAKRHEKIRLKRESDINNVVFQLVNYLSENGYTTLALRKYDVKEMTGKNKDVEKDDNGNAKKGQRKKRRRLNKKILSGAMGMVNMKIKQKCSENGINVFEFDAGETKTTSRCCNCNSEDVNINLTTREMTCRKCEYVEDMDYNASKNILRYALENHER